MIWNLDAKDLSFLGGAASTFLAAFSYWAKTRHERRRATRSVLYYLLEIHHHVRRTHETLKQVPPRYLELTQAALLKKGLRLSENDITGLSLQLDRVLRQFTTAEIQGLLSEFSSPLEKALMDLSREDPVLAFKIRGREQLMLITKKLSAIAANEDALDQEEVKTVLEQTGFFDELARTTTLQQLSAAIRSAAWRCDVFTHFGVFQILKGSSEAGTDEEEMKKFVDALVDSFVPASPLAPSQMTSHDSAPS